MVKEIKKTKYSCEICGSVFTIREHAISCEERHVKGKPSDILLKKCEELDDFLFTDHKVPLDDIVEAINAELSWCYKNPMENIVSLEFRDGFISGLKQVKYFIIELVRSERYNDVSFSDDDVLKEKPIKEGVIKMEIKNEVVHEHCGNCRFWFQQDVNIGFCQRYPPSIPQSSYEKLLPYRSTIISKDDWCGEWVENG